MFSQIVGQSAVVRKGGVYKHCDLYEYRGQLFVKYNGGFVRLNADGRSSVEGIQLDLLAYEGPLFKDRFGRLNVTHSDGCVPLIAQADGTIEPLKIEADK